MASAVDPSHMSGPPDGGGRRSLKLGPFVVATFNARGLTARYKQLDFVRDLMARKVSLCCVQETKLNDDLDFSLSPREDGKEQHRFIFLKPSIPAYGLAFVVAPCIAPLISRHWAVSDRVAVISLRFPLTRGGKLDVHIVNCYGPTAELTKRDPTIGEEFFESVSKTVLSLKNAHSLVILGGDFNARLGLKQAGDTFMGSFGRGIRNDNGRRLAEFAELHNFIVANTCFQHQHKHRTTWEAISKTNKKIYNQIDFVLVPKDVKIVLQQARSYAGLLTQSDHRLVICRLDFKALYVKWALSSRPPQVKRRDVAFLRHDQQLYRDRVDALLLASPPSSCSSPADALLSLNGALMDAANRTVGWKEKTHVANVDVHDLSLRQKQLRDRMRSAKSPELLESLRAERRGIMKLIHKRTKQFALARIDAQVAAVEECKGETQMFAAVQLLRNVERTHLVIKDQDDRIISGAEEMACAAAEHFQKQLCDVSHPGFSPFVGPPRSLSSPISMGEVESVIKELKNNRAAGPDGVEAELYKYGGQTVARCLCDILNDVFETHTDIGTDQGLVCPLPKPGKPKGPCSSLRPVILLNVVRKILSLITLRRIRSKLEPELPAYQSGFRPGRSTADVVWMKRWLVSLTRVYEVEINDLGIDLSRAFDTVIRSKLIDLVDKNPILNDDDKRLIRYLLADNHFRVRCSSAVSPPFTTNMGTPQGDGLSPFLFIWYLNAAIKETDSTLPPLLSSPPALDSALGLPALTAYADDVDRYSTSAGYLEERLRHDEKVLGGWNLHINVSKTERICIRSELAKDVCQTCRSPCFADALQCDTCNGWVHYSCSELAKGDIELLLRDPDSTFICAKCKSGKDDERWRECKSLGSLLGDREDLNNRMRLAVVAFRQHFKIWPRRKFLSLRTRLRIYNAFVLPVLLYNIGALAFDKKMEHDADCFHRRHLRYITGIVWPRIMSNEKLYHITGAKPISRIAKERRWSLFGHICRLPPDVPAHAVMLSFFSASSCLRKKKGRIRLCLATTLAHDLAESPFNHTMTLNRMSDFLHLRSLASDRTRWTRFVQRLCE